MTQKHDGGPAFAHGNHEQGGSSGMSLRDWFAGQALMGLIIQNSEEILEEYADKLVVEGWAFDLSRASYDIAQAMLAVRKEVDEP